MAVGFTLVFVDAAKDVHDAADAHAADVSAVAALDEPTRRRLYEHVVRRPDPVSRDEAAEALGLARQTVAFHLDRLAAESLRGVLHGLGETGFEACLAPQDGRCCVLLQPTG